MVLGSGVADDALPLFSSVVPAVVVSLTGIIIVAVAPLARLPILHFTVPVAPMAGVVQLPLLVV